MNDTIGGYRASYIKTLTFLEVIRDGYLKPGITIQEMAELALAIEQHTATLGPVAVIPGYDPANPPSNIDARPQSIKD